MSLYREDGRLSGHLLREKF